MGAHPAARFVSLALIYVIWGATYLAVRVIVADGALTPLQLQLLRCTAATLVCAALVALGRARRGPVTSNTPTAAPTPASATTPAGASPTRARHALVAMGSGVLLWTLGNGLTTIAAKDAASSFIVMSMGTIPLWTVGVTALFTRRLPGTRVMVALLVGFAGLALVLAPGLTSGSIITPGRAVPIMALLMVSALTWTLGTMLQETVGGEFSIWELSAWQYLGASLTLAVMVVADGAPLHPGAMRPGQWVAFAFLVLFGSLLAMVAYSVVLRGFSATMASTYAYVNPLVGIVLGATFLHETIAPVSLVGLVIVLGAVGAIFAAQSRGRVAPTPAPTHAPAEAAGTPVLPA